MSIADQITRLSNAKAAIKQSIENKGVEVSDSALLDEYPALIDSIEVGSGGEGGADPYYETLWNCITNNNTDYNYLFHNYNGKTLDVSNFDTSNVTDMQSIFYNCNQLTSLDVSNWDTSNVTNMAYMFNSCTNLTSLDVSNFNTSNVTDMRYMFYICSSLTQLDVSNFDTSNVTTMQGMFYNCHSLTSIDVSNFDTSNVTSIYMMFVNCWEITSLDCSNWDISKCTSTSSIGTAFNNCKKLVDFKAPKNISANMSVANSTALSHDSLMSIINNLATVTSSKTLTLGATNLAKLTDEEKTIATNKGWKIA